MFYGPSPTSFFEHFDVSLTNEPFLEVKSKHLDSIAIEKMELALERAKTHMSMKSKTSHGSSSNVQIEEDDDEISREEEKEHEDQRESVQCANLQAQIANNHLRQEQLYKQSCDWRNEFNENFNLLLSHFVSYVTRSDPQIAYLGEKMDSYHSEIMKYLHSYPPPPPPQD